MNKRKRRKIAAALKAKVALEAVREQAFLEVQRKAFAARMPCPFQKIFTFPVEIPSTHKREDFVSEKEVLFGKDLRQLSGNVEPIHLKKRPVFALCCIFSGCRDLQHPVCHFLFSSVVPDWMCRPGSRGSAEVCYRELT